MTGTPLCDWKAIRDMIETCRKKHDICEAGIFEGYSESDWSKPLRLIDVNTLQIVEGSIRSNYFALSYVWGMTKKSRSPQVGDSLKLSDCPQTISDAITATKNLRQPYLWVDQISINQQDRAQLEMFIAFMDIIYSRAVCTLVPLYGDSALAAIPGVQVERNVEPIMMGGGNSTDLGEALQSDLANQISTHAWSTRCWTLQEGAFSRRCIFFTERRFFFQCMTHIGMEHVLHCDHQGKVKQLLKTVLSSEGSSILADQRYWCQPRWRFGFSPGAYRDQLDIYLSRQLSDEDDILRALAGIHSISLRNTRYASKVTYTLGIPNSDFLNGLLWFGEEGASRRPNFASWSWAGWKTRVEYPCWDFILGQSMPYLNFMSLEKLFAVKRVVEATFNATHGQKELHISSDCRCSTLRVAGIQKRDFEKTILGTRHGRRYMFPPVQQYMGYQSSGSEETSASPVAGSSIFVLLVHWKCGASFKYVAGGQHQLSDAEDFDFVIAMEVRLLDDGRAERIRLCIFAAVVWYTLPKIPNMSSLLLV